MMKTLAPAVLLLPLALVAQATGTQKATPNYEIKLRAEDEIAFSGRKVRLRLQIDVKKDSRLPATLLSGYELSTEIDGKAGPTVAKRVSGRVALAAETRMVRFIEIDVDRIMAGKGGSDLHRVSVKWPGLVGVNTSFSVGPDMSKVDLAALDLSKTQVTLSTSLGKMKLKFHPDKAPRHVKNYIKLVKEGFYDGTRFHRVMRGFMIQGGCPYSKKGAVGTPGTGDPGYKIDAEFNDTRHQRGILSAARSNDINSAGCQFFIMHAASSSLDGKYTAFGELVTGHDTLDKIATTPVDGEAPKEDVWIKAAILHPVFKTKEKK